MILTAVISAPRPRPTLPAALASLARAGFRAPVVVYDTDRLGCYFTWRRAAERLLADYFDHRYRWARFGLIFEDDAQPAPGLFRQLVGQWQDWPERCCASLYTARPNHREAGGWHRVARLPHDALGAVAYLLPIPVLLDFMRAPPHPEWPDGTDHAMGLFCRDREIPYLCHSPSLVRHLAVGHENSALSHPGGLLENRQCAAFAGDDEK